MQEESRNRMTVDYAVEHLWLLTSAVYAIGGGDLKTPRYIDIAHPELKLTDNRSADQIKQDILAKINAIPEKGGDHAWTL